ncbi:MAG TPA: haloacid dehalogenase-like hydrolase, partial [Terriglobales bacterium]|nr:haloacid dehalogenase-like hydrolase [Terriglobales bacterium]
MKTKTKFSPAATQFIDSVLALKPRIAVFDCDGTLWTGDSGADFFYWEIEHGLLPATIVKWALPRYEDYKRGNVDEETMCGEMVTINAKLPERRLEEASCEFFRDVVEHRIFPEMLALTHALRAAGCQLWAVSS